MASISYRERGLGLNPPLREEIKVIIDRVKKQMLYGATIMSGGGTRCEFYYGGSPIGFANIMGWKGDNLAVRLTAPDESGLRELTESLGASYYEEYVDD